MSTEIFTQLCANNALYEKRIFSSLLIWTAQIRLGIHAV